MCSTPDLSVSLSVSLDDCNAGQLVLEARVTNLGALGVSPGVSVVFHEDSAAGVVLGSAATAVPPLPGGSTTVSISVPYTQGPDFFVVVDGPTVGAVAECDELNHAAASTGATCPLILQSREAARWLAATST